MMDVKQFQKKLEELMETAKEKEKNLSHEDILNCFGENQLSTEQLKSLYEYLRLQEIQIGGNVLEDIDLEEDRENGQETQEKQDSVERELKKTEMTEENKNCLKEYEEYLQCIRQESAGEREELLRKLAQGNKTVWERLSQLYLPEIMEKAKKYYREDLFIGDLIQEGNMALLSVAVEHIPDDGADLWMTEQIEKGMESWANQQGQQKFQDDYLVEKVRKLEEAIREISDGEEQKFSVAELSAYLNIDEDEIRSILSLTSEGEENPIKNNLSKEKICIIGI